MASGGRPWSPFSFPADMTENHCSSLSFCIKVAPCCSSFAPFVTHSCVSCATFTARVQLSPAQTPYHLHYRFHTAAGANYCLLGYRPTIPHSAESDPHTEMHVNVVCTTPEAATRLASQKKLQGTLPMAP